MTTYREPTTVSSFQPTETGEFAETIKLQFAVQSPEFRTNRRARYEDPPKPPTDLWVMSAFWDRREHPVGVYVEYEAGISHKEAFFALYPYIWEAMQNPEEYNCAIWEDTKAVAVLRR